MSTTLITIDIATQLKALIQSAVDASSDVDAIDPKPVISVTALGIAEDASPDGDSVALPEIAVIVRECQPMQYRSRQRAYPVRITCATWKPSDVDQIVIYTLGHVLSAAFAEPDLTLTTGTYDALVIESAPDFEIDDRTYSMTWECQCHVLAPAS
jgi:hypothetical protein